MVQDTVSRYVDKVATNEVSPAEWDIRELNDTLLPIVPLKPISLTEEEMNGGIRAEEFKQRLLDEAAELYDEKEKEFPSEDEMRELERVVLLKVVDRKWMDNIDDMAQLRQGIGLQSMGGRDPVVEYKLAGFDMFNAMMDSIKEDTARYILHISIRPPEDQARPGAAGPGGRVGRLRPGQGPAAEGPGGPADDDDEDIESAGPGSEGPGAEDSDSEGPDSEGPGANERRKQARVLQQMTRREEVAKVTGTNKDESKKREPVKRKSKKIMPNDPCPCGSGKKYKFCCGRK
jgi:preprotein translocase subunit SecA